jgi:hypothetical protein
MVTSSLDRVVCASRRKYCMEGGKILVSSIIHLLTITELPCICVSGVMFHNYNYYCYEFMIDSRSFQRQTVPSSDVFLRKGNF